MRKHKIESETYETQMLINGALVDIDVESWSMNDNDGEGWYQKRVTYVDGDKYESWSFNDLNQCPPENWDKV